MIMMGEFIRQISVLLEHLPLECPAKVNTMTTYPIVRNSVILDNNYFIQNCNQSSAENVQRQKRYVLI